MISITSASERIPLIRFSICGWNKRNGLIWFIWNYKGGGILPPLCICRTEVVFRVNRRGPVLGRPRHRDITKPVPWIRVVVLQDTQNNLRSHIGNDVSRNFDPHISWYSTSLNFSPLTFSHNDNLFRNMTTISERCQQTQFNINPKL